MTAGELAGFTYEYAPPSSDEAPTLLLLHGTGGDERQLLGVGRWLAPDAALLAPRGSVIEDDGLPRYFRRIPTGDGSAYPFTFDQDEVVERAGSLRAFVVAAQDRHQLVDRPVVAMGFSNGANIAAALLLVTPDLLRAAVLAAPMPILDTPPRADLSAVAALLISGRHDPIATPSGVEALAASFSDAGANVDVHWHVGGHELPKSCLQATRGWLDKLRQATAIDPLP
ncbi:MAG: alpha/beta hydrolase [Actinomycetota bacterium]|nr:alpha/beta hydrolase [Actinomycetota bacterium]